MAGPGRPGPAPRELSQPAIDEILGAIAEGHGRMRACLFSMDETDLRALLRNGADDDAIAAAMATCVAGKWAGHGIGSVTFVQPPRTMSQIGG